MLHSFAEYNTVVQKLSYTLHLLPHLLTNNNKIWEYCKEIQRNPRKIVYNETNIRCNKVHSCKMRALIR